MFKLDSDILGILFAIITFLLPAISALLEKKRKKRKGEVPVQDVEESVEVNGKEFFSLQNVLDEVVQELRQTEEADMLGVVQDAGEEDVPGPQDIPGEAEVHFEDVVAVEEAEPATVEVNPMVCETAAVGAGDAVEGEAEKERKGVKARLKNNPGDMVLFAEIMNPKFKEL